MFRWVYDLTNNSEDGKKRSPSKDAIFFSFESAFVFVSVLFPKHTRDKHAVPGISGFGLKCLAVQPKGDPGSNPIDLADLPNSPKHERGKAHENQSK
jgi:hypothetical protein